MGQKNELEAKAQEIVARMVRDGSWDPVEGAIAAMRWAAEECAREIERTAGVNSQAYAEQIRARFFAEEIK